MNQQVGSNFHEDLRKAWYQKSHLLERIWHCAKRRNWTTKASDVQYSPILEGCERLDHVEFSFAHPWDDGLKIKWFSPKVK